MSEYLIKTEKEIKSCYGCPFCNTNDDLDSEDYRSMYCSYPNMGEFVTDYDACRHPNCPLKELPPHGRLIDADALPIKDEWSVVGTNTIWDAPTVLEASKEESK